MNKKIVLSGYYGYDNIGDEAVMFSIIRDLRQVLGEDIVITVLSGQPQTTALLYKVDAVDRWNKKEVYNVIKECDLFISGGGSLLQDVTSKNSPLYYLALIAMAEFLHKPVVIYSQGIGPLQISRNRYLTKKILNKVRAITVRDKASQDELIEMGVKKAIIVTADPVLGIGRYEVKKEMGEEILSRYDWDKDKKTLMVGIRPWDCAHDFIKETAICCDHMAKEGWQVIFLPMQCEKDYAVAAKVAEQMTEASIVLKEQYTPNEMISIISQADLMLGMRLHALIIAASLDIPVVGIAYDPKVAAFMGTIDSERYQPIEQLEAQLLIDALQQAQQEIGQEVVSADMMERALYPAYLVREALSD